MKKFYSILIKALVHQPLKAFSYLLSHGGLHFLLFICVVIATYLWYNYNIHSSDVTMHNISMGIDNDYEQRGMGIDTLVQFSVIITIDSDTIRKNTNGKYGSGVTFNFNRTPGNWDEKGNSRASSSMTVSVYGIPDLKIDSLYEEKCTTSLMKDSTIEIKLNPRDFSYKRPDGSIREGVEHFSFYSDKLGLSEGESAYNYFFHFGWLPETHNTRNSYGNSMIWIQFGDDKIKNRFPFFENRKILYNFIYPEPDILNNGFIVYDTKEKINAIAKNHGIIIQAEDIDAANNDNRKALIYSLLVGTGLAFALDILVQLVREWRNVNRRDDQEKMTKGSNDINNIDHQKPSDTIAQLQKDAYF